MHCPAMSVGSLGLCHTDFSSALDPTEGTVCELCMHRATEHKGIRHVTPNMWK